MAKKKAVQSVVPVKRASGVVAPAPAAAPVKKGESDQVSAALAWLADRPRPTVVSVVTDDDGATALPLGVWYGSVNAAKAGIAVMPRRTSDGRLELCAMLQSSVGQYPGPEHWVSIYLSDCPLLFITSQPNCPFCNAVYVPDRQVLFDLLMGKTTEPRPVPAAKPAPKPEPEPVKAAAPPVKKAAKPAPKPEPESEPEPEPELEDELLDADITPEEEANESTDDGESDTYTEAELRQMDEKELRTLLTSAGLKVSANASRRVMLDLALQQLE